LRPAAETDGQDNGEPSRLITEWAAGSGGQPAPSGEGQARAACFSAVSAWLPALRTRSWRPARYYPSKGTAMLMPRTPLWALLLRRAGLALSRPGPFPWPGSAARRTCCRAGYQNIADALVTFLRDTSRGGGWTRSTTKVHPWGPSAALLPVVAVAAPSRFPPCPATRPGATDLITCGW